MTDNIFTNNFIYFVWNSIVRISFDATFCLVTFVTFWCNAWVTFVTFLIKIMCSLMHRQKSFTTFVLEILLKYQVTNWWLKFYLCGPMKKLIFFPEINKRFTFPGMGLHGMVLKLSGHVRNTISLLFRQKTGWNSDIWNFFKRKNWFFFQFWSTFTENPLFESGNVWKRHCDVIVDQFSWFWYQWKEETLPYTMIPNNHTLGPSISSS